MNWIFLLLAQHAISLTFTTTPDPDMASLKVQRNGAVVATLPATATTYRDTTVQGGVAYVYSVTAVATPPAADSAPSNAIGITLPADLPKFKAGDTMKALAIVPVKSCTNLAGVPISTIANGSTFVIVSGPLMNGTDAYWKISKGCVLETSIRQ